MERSCDKKVEFQNVFNVAITIIDLIRGLKKKRVENIIKDLIKEEPFCNYVEIEEKLKKYYIDELKK
jgi:predicted nucleic acid-binding OB-fold protein